MAFVLQNIFLQTYQLYYSALQYEKCYAISQWVSLNQSMQNIFGIILLWKILPLLINFGKTDVGVNQKNYIYIYMFMRINYIFRYIIVIRLALSYNPWTILYLWRNLSIEMYYVEYWRRNCSAVSQWLLLYQRMQTIYLKKFPIDIVLQWYPLKMYAEHILRNLAIGFWSAEHLFTNIPIIL